MRHVGECAPLLVMACQIRAVLGYSCAAGACDDTDRNTFLQTGAHVGAVGLTVKDAGRAGENAEDHRDWADVEGRSHRGWTDFDGNGNGNSSTSASLFLHPYDLSQVNVDIPDDYTGKVPLPLVVMLHGYSSYPSLYKKLYGLQERINTDKFIQITPPGRKDRVGYRSWQAWGSHCGDCAVTSAGPCCGDGDVEYIRTIIYAATRNFNVDKQRIYVNGHSDGAAMAYRLACDAADLITAVMIMAGSPPEDNWKPGYACKPSQPVSVLHIHGTEDRDVAYDGSTTPHYRGAVSSAELFAQFNACPKLHGSWFPRSAGIKGKTGGSALPEMAHLLNSGSGNDTEMFRTTGCSGGTDVELWKIIGCGHGPPFEKASYQKHAVAWLLRHRKTAAPSIRGPHCVDKPLSWEDTHANVCQEYAQHKWCNVTGGYGAGWKSNQGSFKDYTVKNSTAATACCVCGGGANTPNLR